MKTLPLSLEDIDARLRDIEAERDALIALRKVYAPEPVAAAPAAAPSSRKAQPVQKAPPLPLIIPTGATPAILKTVSERPGIGLGDLIDSVLKKVPPAGQQSPRKNIANIIGQQVKRGRIEKRTDGFHLVGGA